MAVEDQIVGRRQEILLNGAYGRVLDTGVTVVEMAIDPSNTDRDNSKAVIFIPPYGNGATSLPMQLHAAHIAASIGSEEWLENGSWAEREGKEFYQQAGRVILMGMPTLEIRPKHQRWTVRGGEVSISQRAWLGGPRLTLKDSLGAAAAGDLSQFAAHYAEAAREMQVSRAVWSGRGGGGQVAAFAAASQAFHYPDSVVAVCDIEPIIASGSLARLTPARFTESISRLAQEAPGLDRAIGATGDRELIDSQSGFSLVQYVAGVSSSPFMNYALLAGISRDHPAFASDAGLAVDWQRFRAEGSRLSEDSGELRGIKPYKVGGASWVKGYGVTEDPERLASLVVHGERSDYVV